MKYLFLTWHRDLLWLVRFVSCTLVFVIGLVAVRGDAFSLQISILILMTLWYLISWWYTLAHLPVPNRASNSDSQ